MEQLNVEKTTTSTTNVIPTSAPMTAGRAIAHKPLPTKRSALDILTEGDGTDESRPSGTLRVNNLVELFTLHEADPTTHTSSALASRYGLQEAEVRSVLAYLTYEGRGR